MNRYPYPTVLPPLSAIKRWRKSHCHQRKRQRRPPLLLFHAPTPTRPFPPCRRETALLFFHQSVSFIFPLLHQALSLHPFYRSPGKEMNLRTGEERSLSAWRDRRKCCFFYIRSPIRRRSIFLWKFRRSLLFFQTVSFKTAAFSKNLPFFHLPTFLCRVQLDLTAKSDYDDAAPFLMISASTGIMKRTHETEKNHPCGHGCLLRIH